MKEPTVILSFARSDIERRFLCPSGRFTSAGPVLPFILAVVLTILIYAALSQYRNTWLADSLTIRGWVPYAIVFFSMWALMILFVKMHKIRLQRCALIHRIVPDDPTFILSTQTVQSIMDRLHELADDPREFILYNRIEVGLSNLRNMGQIGDVDNVLRTQADHDEAALESSYTVVRGLIWAIPVLGFLGTVLGLSQAISGFTAVLSVTTDIEAIKGALQSVTSGLATAFETTLQALIGALIVQLLMTAIRRNEEQMNDSFVDYCQRQIVGRLRIRMPSQQEVADASASKG